MKKNTIITIASVLVIAAFAGLIAKNVLGKPRATSVNTDILQKGELIDSISVKGVIESTNSKNVYTTLNYKIKNVNFEEGDTVKAGEVLCELDVADLERQIKQRRAEIEATQNTNSNQLSASQRSYQDALNILNSGNNSAIINAENSVKSAEISLSNAQKNYDEKISEMNNNTNSAIINAQNSLKSAELDLNTKKKALEDNQILYNEGIISYETFHQSEVALETAQNTYDSALSSLDNAQNALQTEIDNLKKSLDSANVTFNNAVDSEEAARISADQEIKNQRDKVTSAEVSLNNDSQLVSLQNLEDQLKDAQVKAPIDGTITAVYAKEGASSNGLLFVIEDTNDLKITSKIKEYDAGRIALGQEVLIKTDVTGDQVFNGVIDKIAPTSIKSNNGEVMPTNDVEFKTEIKVLSKDPILKIGMNTRLTIVIDKLENVFHLPYDSVIEKENGESVIFSVEPNANEPEKFKAVEIPVTTGMLTDFYIEISSDALYEDMKIISDPTDIYNNQDVSINDSSIVTADGTEETDLETSAQ